MIATTALTGVAGLRRSVRTTSYQEPIMRTTPRYKTMTPRKVLFGLLADTPLPVPKNQASGRFDAKGEPLCATPARTQADAMQPVAPATLSGTWRRLRWASVNTMQTYRLDGVRAHEELGGSVWELALRRDRRCC